MAHHVDRRLVAAVLSMFVALAGAACAPAEDPAEPDRETPVMELQPMHPSNPNSPPSTLGKAAEAARRALAEELEIAIETIEVVEQRTVTWPNGALGCPEPGMAYTQALVPGYWIRLRVGDEQFDYHAARGRAPFRCPGDRAERPLPPDDAPEA